MTFGTASRLEWDDITIILCDKVVVKMRPGLNEHSYVPVATFGHSD
jgi:hypothetical protein